MNISDFCAVTDTTPDDRMHNNLTQPTKRAPKSHTWCTTRARGEKSGSLEAEGFPLCRDLALYVALASTSVAAWAGCPARPQ